MVHAKKVWAVWLIFLFIPFVRIMLRTRSVRGRSLALMQV
jgi:hypothetical protein